MSDKTSDEATAGRCSTQDGEGITVAGLPNEPVFAGWLSDLTLAFQDDSRRPDLHYTSQMNLLAPAQIVALVWKTPDGDMVAELAVLHVDSLPNGSAWALLVPDLPTLDAALPSLDGALGTPASSVVEERGYLERREGPLAIAALCLGMRIRGRQPTAKRTTDLQFLSGISMSSPASSLLAVRYAYPLPSPESFLQQLGHPHATAAAWHLAMRHPVGPTSRIAPTACGGFSDPPLWFGVEPFRSARDILRDGVPPTRRLALVCVETVRNMKVLVYSDGLVVALTNNSAAGLAVVNQVFATIARCGVPASAVPAAALVHVSSFAADGGRVFVHWGRSSRNRSLDAPAEPDSLSKGSEELLVIDPAELPAVLRLTHDTVSNPAHAGPAARLFEGASAIRAGLHDAAFCILWAVIEHSIQRIYVESRVRAGASVRSARSQARSITCDAQISALIAGGDVEARIADSLRELKALRNSIVHDAKGAKDVDADRCLRLASELAALPMLAAPLKFARAII